MKRPSTTFRSYRVVSRVVIRHVYGMPSPLVLEVGDVIVTDGVNVRLGGGRSVSSSGIANAIAAGLLVPLKGA